MFYSNRKEYFNRRNEPLSPNELILEGELDRQSLIYRALGLTRASIMSLLAPRPEGIPSDLTAPVVTLGTSVDLKRQANLGGIQINYDFSRGYDTNGGITFATPHLIWMQDGSKYKGKSVEDVRNILKTISTRDGVNERPATQYDLIALALVHPNIVEVLRNHSIDAPGTSFGCYAPILKLEDGKLIVSSEYEGSVSPCSGSVSCGIQ